MTRTPTAAMPARTRLSSASPLPAFLLFFFLPPVFVFFLGAVSVAGVAAAAVASRASTGAAAATGGSTSSKRWLASTSSRARAGAAADFVAVGRDGAGLRPLSNFSTKPRAISSRAILSLAPWASAGLPSCFSVRFVPPSGVIWTTLIRLPSTSMTTI